MKISRGKRILSFLTVIVLVFSSYFTTSMVWGDDQSFLTGVKLVTEDGKDLYGTQVMEGSTVSIVYSYEKQESLHEMIPNPEEPPVDEENPKEDRFDFEQNGQENKPGNEGENGGAENSSGENEEAYSENGSGEEGEANSGNTEYDKGNSNSENSETSASSNNPESNEEKSSFFSAALFNRLENVWKPKQVFADSSLFYTIQIPKEFDLSQCSEFDVMDDKNIIVGKGIVLPLEHKATIEFFNSAAVKGEFCIQAKFETNLDGPSGKNFISFSLGNGENYSIPLEFIPNPENMMTPVPVGTEQPMDFVDSVTLTRKKTGVIIDRYTENIEVTELVRIDYHYVIPVAGSVVPNVKYTFSVPNELQIKDVAQRKFFIYGVTKDAIVAKGSVDQNNDAYIEFTDYA